MLRTLWAAALLLAICATIHTNASAEDPEWFVKKDTWVETYTESLLAMQRLEREAGETIPAPRNDESLPVVLVCENQLSLRDVPLDVDVSGIKTLYIGSTSWMHVRDCVLIKNDGTEEPLLKDNNSTVPFEKIGERGRVWAGGQFETHESDAAIQLDGKFKRIVGKINVCDGHMGWLDRQPHADDLYQPLRLRRDVRGWADRVLYEKYSDRKQADKYREAMHRLHFAMPSGLVPFSYQQAAESFVAAMAERYERNDTDPRLFEQVRKLAENCRTSADFNRLARAGIIVTYWDDFRWRRDKAERTPECPGLVQAFAPIEKAYFVTDPMDFDAVALREQFEDFDDLVELCKKAYEFPELARKTIEYVAAATDVPGDPIANIDELEQQLQANKGDITKFLATYEQMKKVRRDVLFLHPDLAFDRILLNRVPPPAYSHNGDQHLGRHGRLGPGITILSDWKSGNPKVEIPLAGKLPEGTVRNPDLHYDADKVVFAFCDHTQQDRNRRRFFLYEAAIDGSWVRQLTGTDRDPLGTWNDRATVLIEDNDPCYLPDGGLVFISTRGQSFGRCHGGRYNPAWVLHRCDANGDNIRQISFNNENEYEPSVLNDGRIVFTRWEYTNRHEMLHHMLWACRPDGTNITHYYGNDTLHPMEVVEASAIPGTHKIVATAQGHHSYNTGTSVIIDINLGENGEEPITRVTPETPYSESHGWPKPHYSHPCAINEELFLVSRANHPVHHQGQTPPVDDRAIYLVDIFGGREKIYEDPEVASFSPIAIRPRMRPPVFPQRAGFDNSPDFGAVFVQNVYLTQNDPEGLIEPGSIKKIRINAIGVQPRASRTACSMTVPVEIPKKVLGTVPVDENGAAHFIVPARTALQVQILDETGRAILTEKSFFYVQPGESRSCVGCHAAPGTTALTMSSMRLAPRPLDPYAGPKYEGGLSFMRTVQPVLDRYCVGCHGLDKTEGDVNLVHDGATWPQSYQALIARGDHRIGLKGYKTNESYISRPYEYYAYGNKVSQMLLDNHGKCNMDQDSYMRIIEWMDINAQCYGDLFPNKLEERRINAEAMTKLREFIREKFGDKLADQPERALINTVQTDESRILMATLSEEAGGWGQIDGFKSKDDPEYKQLKALVDACIERRENENINGWKPTLEMGAGESWVMQAREQLIREVRGEEETPDEE